MNPLTHIERVLRAISHEQTDRLPRGELLVEEAFLDKLYPEAAYALYTEKMRRLTEDAGLDLVTVRVKDEEGSEDLEKWAIETPYFVMALVDGLFWKAEDPLSFQDFIMGICRAEEQTRELIENKKKRALQLIRECVDKGAHGFIVGDDLAYDRGPFVAPEELRNSIFPGHKEIVEAIKKENKVAFLHSCGNLNRILDPILSTGFDGIHGLAPSAGNDPMTIKQITYKKLALMGIFEPDLLGPQEIEAMKKEILTPLAEGGGYIIGSAGGLSLNTSLDSFRALYS